MNIKKILFSIILLSGIFSFAFSQEIQDSSEILKSVNSNSEENVELDPKTGFPVIKQSPFVMFNYGLSSSLVTRIEIMDDRSNFVYQNSLLGAFVTMQTVNIQPLNNYTRLAFYYPVANSFNGMKQKSKQIILGAVDAFWGPMFESDMWKYVLIKASAGPHFMYQMTDEYNFLYFGLGLLAEINLPVAKSWTVIANGMFSLDYANLGSNRNIQPFDYSWNYQLDVGFRYSKKSVNKYSYIDSKKK